MEDIQLQYVARRTAAGLPEDNPANWSIYSHKAIWVAVISFAIWSLENIFDLHRAEVSGIIDNLKPHTARWYANAARAYLHGVALPPDTDKYDTSSLTTEQLAAARVVSFAAVVEAERGLRIKVANDNGTDLEPLTEAEMDGFTEYMSRIKDAGVKLLLTTAAPDGLRLSMEIYYDPLVLDSEGRRLDGSNNTPVQQAIAGYLRNLPFNGVFVLAYLVDVLQQVPGVVVPHVVAASAQYGALPYTPFGVQYQPDAGYLRLLLPEDLTITWIPKSAI